jgi:NAD(P)-dependent dehydrogenase (short-subunit alcohol dehydrogenase family)
METSLKGKTAIVTGGTNGIGLVTARELARMGAHVTIISRSEARCFAAAEAIRQETGQPVEFITADLSTLQGILQAASDFKHHHTRLEILVNNAGALFMNRKVTADGYEMTFALNHLNYFLLTNLLLDLLKASAPARIVNVSSGAHLSGRINFEDLMGEKHYRGMRAYGQSKLANVLFTNELARRLEGTGVTANSLHPGTIRTGFARNNGILYEFGMSVVGLFFPSQEEGAQTSIYLASSPEVEGVTGKYFYKCKEAPTNPIAQDPDVAQELWQVSLELSSQAA